MNEKQFSCSICDDWFLIKIYDKLIINFCQVNYWNIFDR